MHILKITECVNALVNEHLYIVQCEGYCYIQKHIDHKTAQNLR